MSKSNGLVGSLCAVFISFSLVVLSLTSGTTVFAADTGGYPWFDASEVNANNYDWGYSQCRPEMVESKTCSVHYGYRNGQTFHISDPWRYDVRNCTSFVAWKYFSKYNIKLNNWGDAKNWDSAARRSGYRVDNQAQLNDIAVWDSGRYGHVAYVTEVNTDGSVNVEQYNKAGKGEFSRQSRVKADHYIHAAPAEILTAPVISVTQPPTINELIEKTSAVKASSVPQPKVAEAVPVTSKEIADLQNIASRQTTTDSSSKQTSQTTQDPQKDDATSYFVGSLPTKNKVKAYAIKHKNTGSGKVEVRSMDFDKDNDDWDKETVTPEVIQVNSTNYTLGDYNADGTLDLYAINYSSAASGNVEVSVLDGQSGFNTYLGKWVTSENKHTVGDVWYGITDKNGDGSLDLYQIWQNNTRSEHLEMKVLDGKSNFSMTLTNNMLAEKTHHVNDSYYMLGDINSDGQFDLFQILHNNTKSNHVEIKVFDGSEEFVQVISKWSTDNSEYSGVGPEL